MAEWTKELHELCEMITDEIKDANKKLEKNGGKLTAGDLDYIDKLTHTLKSLKTILAMEEEYEDDEYSGARGRMYARRDQRGRYSRDNGYYSRNASYEGDMSSYKNSSYEGRNGRYSREDAKERMMDHLRELEMSAPDERTKHMVKSWIRQAESE